MLEKRREIMKGAFERNPERFVKGVPVLQNMPEAVWINPPETSEERMAKIELIQKTVMANRIKKEIEKEKQMKKEKQSLGECQGNMINSVNFP